MFPSKPVDSATEPSSQTADLLFRIPLWMDLSMHAVPALVLLLGKSFHTTVPRCAPSSADFILLCRLLFCGETIYPPKFDGRCGFFGGILWDGVLALGGILRHDQRAVPISVSQRYESGPEGGDVCGEYNRGVVDVLAIERATSVDGTNAGIYESVTILFVSRFGAGVSFLDPLTRESSDPHDHMRYGRRKRTGYKRYHQKFKGSVSGL